MPTDVKLPQMGESIYEGTITKWLKKEGDFVKKDEALYELSTDKVDSEIPSPVAGRLLKIVVGTGTKVPIHTVVAQVEEGGDGAKMQAAPVVETTVTKKMDDTRPTRRQPEPAPQAVAVAAAPKRGEDRQFASPLVRKIAKDENVDLSQVRATGPQGRITKEDITAYVEQRKGGVKAQPAARSTSVPMPTAPPTPRFNAGERTLVEPMSPMRLKIAEHMLASRRTSAHVASVFEADMSKVVALREKERDDYERVHGVKLTFTPFYATAAIRALKEFPIVNASVEGNTIVYKRDVNLGIAVALPDGLIVPVVQHADELSFLSLGRAINDLAERARSKKLKLDEVQGGTFTITNPGIYGGLFGIPIINQPQVAIMGIGGIEKRPVVINDAIAIRSMGYISMSYDHRIVDGAVADQFLAHVKKTLSEWNLPIK